MSFKPTKAQEQAIFSKENTLVSAAAGSGKTAVLVQRVIDQLTDSEHPLMADRVLIVTFTNAAAAELKLRIEKKLNEVLQKDPYNQLIQRQKLLLPNAKITTIDSFCISFIRDNFEKAGVDPSFKIADNSDYKLLVSSSMSRLLNDEFNSGNSEFIQLLEYVGSDYDDRELAERISEIFYYSRKMPYPDKWIMKVVESYEKFANGEDDCWFSDAIKIVKDFANEAKLTIEKGVKALELNSVAWEKYKDNIFYISDYIKRINTFCENDDWDGIYNIIPTYSPPPMNSLSSKYKTVESDYAKAQRDAADKLLRSIFKFVYGSKQILREEIGQSLPHIRKIAQLTVKFAGIVESELLSRGLMTFDMVEQKALSMLTEYDGGSIILCPNANEYISAYDAVLVDEYQDTNNLQDTLFNALSDDQKKLFCVGDVKQSIYRFRGANPHNFIEKKKIYKGYDTADRFGLRVDLSGNFRSRSGICEYVNRLFGFIMHDDTAEIEYDDKERLEPLSNFPKNSEPEVEHHFIDLKEMMDSGCFSDGEVDRKIIAEGNIIAKIIKNTIDAEPFLKSENGLRKAEYKDITILMRSPSKNGSMLAKILREHGIPVSVSDRNAFESDEVITVWSLLKVINNPFDDIALLTVMSSPFFRFTMDELAAIRSLRKRGKFISAVTVAANQGDIKAKDLIDSLSSYRDTIVTGKVYELIDRIYETTNMLGVVSRLYEGDIKKSNLLMLRNLALSFEAESKRSLRDFLFFLEGVNKSDFKNEVQNSGDTVCISTIHSSKGLQFPICILADTDHQFNFSDCYSALLVDEHYGFSLKYSDTERKERADTLLRVLMSEYEKGQLMAEEIRLLYVALTRAEEKLIITSCFNDLKKEISAISDMGFAENGRIRKYSFRSTKSYADWLLADEFYSNTDKYLDYLSGNKSIAEIHTYFDRPNSNFEQIFEQDEEICQLLSDNYSLEYPFAELLGIEAKASVTDIVHKADESKYQFTSKPAFMNDDGMNAAEKGTSTHKFMQFCDYSLAAESVSDECQRLYEKGYLTEAESECVDKSSVQTFFNSDLYKRISVAENVRREMNFLSEFPAGYIRPDLDSTIADEKIIVQGAVDLLFEEKDGLVIVDFKTDRNKSEDDLQNCYREQLSIYGKACESLFKKPLKQLLLYSFALGKAIEM